MLLAPLLRVEHGFHGQAERGCVLDAWRAGVGPAVWQRFVVDVDPAMGAVLEGG